MKQSDLFPAEERHAILSKCGQYRYALRRRWAKSPSMIFVMLNPSKADAEIDDPTIRKCRHFAKAFGYNGFIAVNLFAFRATSPADMKRAADPVGCENDTWLRYVLGFDTLRIAAWGKHGTFIDRDRFVQRIGFPMHCLGINGDGTPRHPLYLPNDTQPIPYGGRQ